jgi:preprotein translocase subunit SecA
MLQTMMGKVFGTKNDRELKKYKRRLKRINALEPKYEAMDDAALQAAFAELKTAVQSGEKQLDAAGGA